MDDGGSSVPSATALFEEVAGNHEAASYLFQMSGGLGHAAAATEPCQPRGRALVAADSLDCFCARKAFSIQLHRGTRCYPRAKIRPPVFYGAKFLDSKLCQPSDRRRAIGGRNSATRLCQGPLAMLTFGQRASETAQKLCL